LLAGVVEPDLDQALRCLKCVPVAPAKLVRYPTIDPVYPLLLVFRIEFGRGLRLFCAFPLASHATY
jgi:hypothetical protein